MTLDPISILAGFVAANIVQKAIDKVAWKLIGRILKSAIGKRAVIEAMGEALTKLDTEEGRK
jgi:hypothetical protein